MSSIRTAVKTIASFILHFLDTNCQGLDLQRGRNLMGIKTSQIVLYIEFSEDYLNFECLVFLNKPDTEMKLCEGRLLIAEVWWSKLILGT